MRLGLALPHYDTSFAGRPFEWDSLVRIARLAETSGFDSIWVSDHLFFDWSKYGGPDDPQGTPECFMTMSALAAVTERVRIGSLALCNDFRNPALLAKMIATLDRLSAGRIDIAMGAGWYEPEYAAAGIEFAAAGDRIRRLGESLQILSRLLTGEVLDFDGEHYHLKGALCRPIPQQEPRPALWVGGKGDFLLRTAIRHADGWNFSWIGDFDVYRQRAERANRLCEAEGRDPAGFRRSVGVYLLAGDDQADLERRFERLAKRTPSGILRAPNSDTGVSWEEFRERNLVGTPDEVAHKLGELAELGVEEVVCTLGSIPFQLGDEEDVAYVGEKVIPAIGR
ncbi:MAG: LLM class flavin-dependent oxidoreductase [Actinomycetota bacterium]